MINIPENSEKTIKISMGKATDNLAKQLDIKRKHQDELALLSHVKTCKAQSEG